MADEPGTSVVNDAGECLGLSGAPRARRVDRPHVTRREPVQDDRRARRARHGPDARRVTDERRLTWRNHSRRPGVPPEPHRAPVLDRRAGGAGAPGRAAGPQHPRRGSRARMVGRGAHRRHPGGDRPPQRPRRRRRRHAPGAAARGPPTRARPGRHARAGAERAARCPQPRPDATWAATTRSRSPASCPRPRTAPGSRSARSRTRSGRSTWSWPAASWCAWSPRTGSPMLRPSPTASAATARSSRTTSSSTGRCAAWAAWGSWIRSCSRSAASSGSVSGA